MKRVSVCFWQDNINLILQVSTQHISKIRKKASFSVAVFTEDDTYSLGSSIQNIMVGHLTCQQRKEQIFKYQTQSADYSSVLNRNSRNSKFSSYMKQMKYSRTLYMNLEGYMHVSYMSSNLQRETIPLRIPDSFSLAYARQYPNSHILQYLIPPERTYRNIHSKGFHNKIKDHCLPPKNFFILCEIKWSVSSSVMADPLYRHGL